MHFDPTRRSALKQSGLALASVAAALVPEELSAQSDRASTLRSTVLNVRVYGATGDGKTIDSPAINQAIDAAASMGGGTVLFPAGTYLSFSIRLRSHVQLRLEPGATILAADSPLLGEATGYNGGTYDFAEPNAWDAYQGYGHNHWHNSLIWGEGLENCSIVGPGLIWGRGSRMAVRLLMVGSAIRSLPSSLALGINRLH